MRSIYQPLSCFPGLDSLAAPQLPERYLLQARHNQAVSMPHRRNIRLYHCKLIGLG